MILKMYIKRYKEGRNLEYKKIHTILVYLYL
jgi:hypothetical protein